MIVIDGEKFLQYLIFSKHADDFTCGELKVAIEKCRIDVSLSGKIGKWNDRVGETAICGCCNRINNLYGDYCKWCGAKMEV